MEGTRGTVYIKSDHTKKTQKKAKHEIKKLDTLKSETETIIYEISSVFPFQLFPDKIVIDKNKVTIVRKDLFYKRIFPMLIEDIRTVKVSRGPFFASMEFEIKDYEQNPSPTTFLWPNEASKAEHYILGLVKANRDKVDLSKMTIVQIKKRIEGIGGGEEEIKNLF